MRQFAIVHFAAIITHGFNFQIIIFDLIMCGERNMCNTYIFQLNFSNFVRRVWIEILGAFRTVIINIFLFAFVRFSLSG